MILRNQNGLIGAHRRSIAGFPGAERRWAVRTLTVLLAAVLATPALGQQAHQPSFDPKQADRRFNEQNDQDRGARSALKLPALARPEASGNSRPQFLLRDVLVRGAQSVPADRLAGTYQRFLGKEVSQAGLVAISTAISDVYRAAGFHLSAPSCRRKTCRMGGSSSKWWKAALLNSK